MTFVSPLETRCQSARFIILSRRAPHRSAASIRKSVELPLMGFPKIAPLSIEVLTVHSRILFQGRVSIGTRLPSLIRVPPAPFLTTSVVFSGDYPAGLLHPAADYGVRRVSSSDPLGPPGHPKDIRENPPLSRSQATSTQAVDSDPFLTARNPSKYSPRATAPSTSPWTMPSRHSNPPANSVSSFFRKRTLIRCPSGNWATSRLCSVVESVAAAHRFRRSAARYSLGLHFQQGPGATLRFPTRRHKWHRDQFLSCSHIPKDVFTSVGPIGRLKFLLWVSTRLPKEPRLHSQP